MARPKKLKAAPPSPALASVLGDLDRFGGIYSQAARALRIVASKTADYNGNAQAGVAGTDLLRDVYFPFGQLSYLQMLHTKVQRCISLVQKEAKGIAPNHESLLDSYLDLVNYALFAAERLERDGRKKP